MKKNYKLKNKEINDKEKNKHIKESDNGKISKIKNKEKIIINIENYKKEYKNIYKNTKNYHYISIILLLSYLILFLPLSLTNEIISTLRKLYYDSEVTVFINGIGEQNIIYNRFYTTPYQVEVNGQILDNPTKKAFCSREKDNIVIIRFNSTLITLDHMFFSVV